MIRKTKFAKAADCPTCGATPCHQKWKPRRNVDFSECMRIDDCNPVDAVHCHRCDMVFSVSHFEHDGEYNSPLRVSNASSAARVDGEDDG